MEDINATDSAVAKMQPTQDVDTASNNNAPTKDDTVIDTTTKPKKDGNKKKWFPLESNPTLMNLYCSKLGWDTSKYCWHDVYGLDDWALEMIPQPVLAVIMLYPLSEKQLQHELIDEQQKGKNNINTDSDK